MGGGWLAAIREINSTIDLLGLDGEWVTDENRVIPGEFFKQADLTKRISLERKYDLALSLEVAEHLDEQYADIFIDNICSHADVVVFSAAIPLMGGTHHVNEQWQSYWINKFSNRGYSVLDVIRPVFWDNKNVVSCYKQDMLLYVKNTRYDEVSVLFNDVSNLHTYNIVHPDKYIEAKAVDKVINRAWMMKHLPEWLFVFLKKIYLIFGKDRIV